MSDAPLWWPDAPGEFSSNLPTREEWLAEVSSGWPPCDGSSASLDDLEGILIGCSGDEYRPDLPANLHDYHYRVIRRLIAYHQVDETVRAAMQAAADQRHYEGLMACTTILVGFSGWKARRRAWVRYQALRWLGRRSTLPRSSERYTVASPPGPLGPS